MFDMDDVSAFTIDAFMTVEKINSYVGFGSRKINNFLKTNMEIMYKLYRCC